MRVPSDEQLTWVLRVGVAFSLDEGVGRAVLGEVVRRVPEVGKASEARLVRYVRERVVQHEGDGGGGVVLEGAGARLLGVLRGLDRAEREAWLLEHGAGVDVGVQGLVFGEGAAGVRGRVEAAERALRGGLGDAGYVAGLEGVVSWFGGLRASSGDGVVVSALGGARRERRVWAVVSLGALAVFLGVMGFVVTDLLGWDEEQAALEVFSNPMPMERAPENVAPASRGR